MHNVNYVELHTTNVDQARGFYGELFGWKFNTLSPAPRYDDIVADQKGGLMEEAQGSGYWLQYIDVADVTASAKKAEKLGGKVLKQKTEVPGAGWFAIVADPGGATFALWQKA
ncbi:MAG: VOC family protein [Myxococcaceae bacterium]|nr:VOC family protein [Myxococcaceae bacterium]